MTVWLEGSIVEGTLLLLTGGSTIAIFAKAWAEVDYEHKNKAILTLTDERYGIPGHRDSNWQQLQNLEVDLSNPRNLPVLQSGLSLEETAQVWNQKLRRAVDYANKVIAIFGIGADSHIAGIKPSSPPLHESSNLAAAYKADDFERITITPAIFPLINEALIFASGDKKHAALELLEKNLDSVSFPDQLIKQTGQFTVYYQT